MKSTKVIVSSSVMKKKVREALGFPVLEVEICIDKIVFHLMGIGTVEIPCHSAYNHSPRIKFERKRWEEMLVFLDRIPEQPIVFECDVNDNGVSLSDVTIRF